MYMKYTCVIRKEMKPCNTDANKSLIYLHKNQSTENKTMYFKLVSLAPYIHGLNTQGTEDKEFVSKNIVRNRKKIETRTSLTY